MWPFVTVPNSGTGGDLSITMHPPTKVQQPSKAESNLGRFKSFELIRVDKIELQVPADSDVSGLLNGDQDDSKSSASITNTARSSAAGPERSGTTQVEIRCRGALEFDFDEMQLSLNDHVDVIRHNPNGPSDQLNCQELRVHFDQSETTPRTTETAPVKLAPTKLVAVGFPVTLRANSYGAFARGEQLEFDLVAQRVTMRDRKAVLLGNDRFEVTSKWLWYEVKEGKQLGTMRAGGPGRVTGRLGTEERQFQANWKTEVLLQSFNGNDVLSLIDDAHVAVEGAGELFADQLHVYLKEQPKAELPSQTTIAADRLKAIGNVRVDSPRLAGTLQDVQIWFKDPAANNTRTQQRTNTGGSSSSFFSSNVSTDMASGDTASGDTKKLIVQADRLNAEIELGDNPQLLQLAAQGHVHCEEQAKPGTVSSMSLDCDVFQVLEGTSDNPIATIEGKPARVAAQGAQIVGETIEIHQGSNRAFIKGAGQMTLPRPQSPQAPWYVQWQHRMRFDGQQATFEGDVNARGMQIMKAGEQLRFNAKGESLGVTLTHYVDFRQPKNTDQLGLRELAFNGQCFFESETLAPNGTRKTSEKMLLHDLRVDQIRGTLRGDGPGWLTSVHQGQDIFKEGQFVSSPRGLHFLRVDFQQELRGNVTGKQIEFLGNVRTVYGPVTGWDQVIDVTNPSRFGPRDVVVTSHRLALADMGQSRDRFDSVELEATGNAFVRGTDIQRFRPKNFLRQIERSTCT